MSDQPAWHRHTDLRCVDCGVLVYPRATCARRGKPSTCPIPRLVRCAEHKQLAELQGAHHDSSFRRPVRARPMMRWIAGAIVLVVLAILVISGMAQAELSLAQAILSVLGAVALLELRVVLRLVLSLVGINV